MYPSNELHLDTQNNNLDNSHQKRGFFDDFSLFGNAYADEIEQPKRSRSVDPFDKNNLLDENLFQKTLIGSGRSFVNGWQGAKQLGLQIGEKIGLADKGSAKKYTQSINEETNLYNYTPVGQSTAAKFGEFGTDILTGGLIPGGAGLRGAKLIKNAAKTGAFLGFIKATEDGSFKSRGINTVKGYGWGAIGGHVYNKAAPAINKAGKNAFRYGYNLHLDKKGLSQKNIDKIITQISKPINHSQTDKLHKIGQHFEKHSIRNAERWGKVKGSASQKNADGLKHIEEILKAPGKFKLIEQNGAPAFIEKRLSDGRGVRLQRNFEFKGFLDPEHEVQNLASKTLRKN